ncbi:hypothetical protein M406DRAFT_73466 [Cryphonectria parasitica EP155]|uniref:Cytochrome P450 n=1 Tax=Cryphonectria parasitica (strain ATCC 38755 / EP155) TaxID=660469 RepID=A0A9P4XUB0_CRYP1|nr:uncharacterized protein M406DRAFT_73466 [Cryphonectria parasitica EP155]KAF3761018.1 hypothetical protein M406DRAFT_73466 [Cryphonectria parasitica EP155]
MIEWTLSNGLLPWLTAAICLLIASRAPSILSSSSGCWLWTQRRVPARIMGAEDVPTLDGNDIYYDGTRWPQYEARFNLRLSRLYGPVIRLRLRPKNPLARLFQRINTWIYPGWRHTGTTILINSLADNESTLKRLLTSCTSRAPSIAAGKYLSGGQRIVLQPYGPDWTRHRKAFSLLLTRDQIRTRWARALRLEAMVMVDRIARLDRYDPPEQQQQQTRCTELVDEVSRFTASSVLQIAYARRAPTPEDPVLKELEVVSRNIASAFTPGRYWADAFPILDIFPAFLSPWKRKLKADHVFESGLFNRLLRVVEDRLASDRVSGNTGEISVDECGAAQLLRKQQDDHYLGRDGVAYLAAGLFEAGTETTAMSINTFLLAAACYPEVTRRAQAEIDSLLKDRDDDVEGHTLTFDDLEYLPYLAGVVKETLRLTPTGSSGVGHTPTTAEPLLCDLKNKAGKTLRKLYIAPGATVLANIYGLHRDAKAYPDPWCFRPDRWLPSSCSSFSAGNDNDKAGDSSRYTKQKDGRPRISLDHTHANFAFGFGKRICPGGALASYSLSMALALLLLHFDFELTGAARALCAQMESQNRKEYDAWTRLFPIRGQEVLEAECLWREDYEDERDRIGKVLIDAYVTFKLSRGQLDRCLRLRPRRTHVTREVLTKM